MTNKTEKQFYFDVQLSWLGNTEGSLSSKAVKGVLHVGTPPAFGGEGTPWTPEHFFLSAISSCYMSTYLLFVKKIGFEISGFECDIIGQILLVEGTYKFTKVDVYPKIYIEEEKSRAKANLAAEKTHKYCLVTNSINAAVFYHTEILLRQAKSAV